MTNTVIPFILKTRLSRSQNKKGGEAMSKYTLKALRANADMKQTEVAEKLGISTTTWSKWENKKRFPTVDQVEKISKLFNVAYDDIIFLP